MLYSRTNRESDVTEYTLVCEDLPESQDTILVLVVSLSSTSFDRGYMWGCKGMRQTLLVADYCKVDMLCSRYKSVNFGAFSQEFVAMLESIRLGVCTKAMPLGGRLL